MLGRKAIEICCSNLRHLHDFRKRLNTKQEVLNSIICSLQLHEMQTECSNAISSSINYVNLPKSRQCCCCCYCCFLYESQEPNLKMHKFFYRDADKSLARPTSQYILFDSENISFEASLVKYMNSTNIHPIMMINRIYEHQNLLSLQLVCFLVGLRTYQHPCNFIMELLFSRKATNFRILNNRCNRSFNSLMKQ